MKNPFSLVRRNIGSRKNRQITRKMLSLAPNWAEVALEERALMAVVTWDGGASTMNWGDANNWSGNVLPTAVDDVVIPDLTGVQTIQVNIAANAKTLSCVENLTIQASQSLTLRAGNSQVSGVFTVAPGGTITAESGSNFTPTGSVVIDGANLYARDSSNSGSGGKLNLARASSYINTQSQVTVLATGIDSLIDLSGLSSLQNGGASGTSSAFITLNATSGGKIDLKNINQFSAGSGSQQSIILSASGTSQIDLTNLTDFVDGSGVITSSISVASGASIISPKLKNIQNVYISHDGGSLNVSSLETGIGGGISVKSGTVNYTSLISFKSGMIEISGGSIGLSALTNIDNSGLIASNGTTINLSQIVSYKNMQTVGTYGADLFFQASGANSSINLSGLKSLVSGGAANTDACTYINAIQGGKVDLSNVTQISSPARGYYFGQFVRVMATDSNSVVDLSSLVDFQDGSGIDSGHYSKLTASNSGAILTTSLKTIQNVGITHDGGIIDVSKIETSFESFISVRSGNVDYSSLASFRSGLIEITGGNVSFNSLTNIDNTGLTVSNGRTLSLNQIATYKNYGYERTFQAIGSNSLINLGGLQEIVSGGASGVDAMLYIRGIQGGKIDLRNVLQISSPSSGYYYGQFVSISATDSNSVINLSKLVDFQDSTGYDGQSSILMASNSGTILTPSLKSIQTVSITHDGGFVDVSKIDSGLESNIIVNSGTINYSSLASFKGGLIEIKGGTIGLPVLTNIDHTGLIASGGTSINVNLVTSYFINGYERVFRASGAGSQISLDGLQSIVSGSSDRKDSVLNINALLGGNVNLRNVNRITVPSIGYLYGQAVIIKSIDNNSVIDLSNLNSFQDGGFESYNYSSIIVTNNARLILPANGFQIKGAVNFQISDSTVAADLTLYQNASFFGGDNGKVIGNIINYSGKMELGFSNNSVGKFIIQGNYTQKYAATLTTDIIGSGAGTGYDQLIITGTANFEGRLIIDRQSFSPLLDSTYRIITYNSLGTDSWISSLPSASNNVLLTKTTNSNDITIKAIPAPPVFVDDAYSEEGDASGAGGPVRNMAFTIRGVAPFGGITVNYASSGGNPGVDYTPVIGSFTITASGAYSQVINVPILGNQRIQPDRLFNLQATADGITPYTGQGLIYDDDAPVTMTLAADYATANTNAAFSPSPSVTITNKHGHLVEGATVQMSVFAAAGGQTATFAGGATTATVTSNASGVAAAPTLTANNLLGGPYSLAFRAVNPDGTTAANGLMALRNVGAPTVLVDSGSGQLAPVGTNYANPFKVKVVNAAGAGIAGVTVTFTPPASGASGSFAGGVNTAVTDINGIATSAVFTANSTTGTYLVTASATGYASATLQATNQNALKPLIIFQGNGQTATVNTAFSQTIKIRTVDLNDNPVPGVTVTFALPASGASGSFAGGVTTAVTDSNGVATAPVLTANTTSGAFVVTASVSGSLPVSVNLTNNPGAAASVTSVSGGSQVATVETAFANPFKARVRDAYGNLVPGVSVTFAAPNSGASLRYAGGSNVAVSGADGVATSAAMTANGVSGNYTVTASATGASSAAFAMTNASATAASIALTSGSGQSATVATGFAAALKVKASDSFGNPVAGVTVTFALPATGASASMAGGVLTAVTGNDGIATSAGLTANTVAGVYTVTASASGLGSVNFSLTNTAGAASGMNVVSGSGQSAKVGVAFANPLKIAVVDAYGNAVAGRSVTFTAPASGATAIFAGGVNTSVSGADGVATSAILTANNLAGAYLVTASSAGLSNKTFALTNTVFSITSFDVVDGSILSVRFNDTIATSGLQINDVYTGNTVTEEADLVVKDSTGAVVKGSMIVATDLRSVQFVKTGLNFAVGSYTVKLRSNANAFRASDGTLLDGNSDGTPGGDYQTSFNVTATSKTLTIPDVVRGPGQDLRVSPTDNGIPVKISDGLDVYSFEMSINYDPNLLSVSELVVPSNLTSSLDLTYNVTVPGRIDIVGVATAGLPSGSQTLFFVRGSVPTGALYRTKCTLDVSNLKLYKLDGTNFTTTVDSGIMLNSYSGDVTGDGRYNSLDALRIQRYLVNLDRWFAQYPLVDPVVIADITGDGRVNSLDSLFLQRYLVNIPVSYITAPPVSSVTQTTGLDPIIRFPSQLSETPGQIVQVPVEIYNSDTQPVEVSSFEFTISIDPSLLRFVSMKSIGQLVSKQNTRKSVIAFAGVIPTTKLNPGDSVQFAWLNLRVRPEARLVDTVINMLDEAQIGRDRYLTSLNSGDLVLGKVPTTAFDESIDTKVTINSLYNKRHTKIESISMRESRKFSFNSLARRMR